MKTVMLFGGAGFIGKNIAKSLLKSGCRVVIYDRNNPGLNHKCLSYICGNIENFSLLEDSLRKYNVSDFVYLINNIPVNIKGIDIENLLEINRNIIKIAYIYVERIIFFSSGGRVYGQGDYPHNEMDFLNPICLYGKSKVYLENFLIDYSNKIEKKCLILRPSNPYGPYQNIYGNQGLISIILGNLLFKRDIEIWGDGDEVRDYIYIDDFCEMFLKLFLASNLPYIIYNLGSGTGVSTNEIVKICISLDENFKPHISHKKIENLVKKNILDIGRYREKFKNQNFLDINSGIHKYYEYLLIIK